MQHNNKLKVLLFPHFKLVFSWFVSVVVPFKMNFIKKEKWKNGDSADHGWVVKLQ